LQAVPRTYEELNTCKRNSKEMKSNKSLMQSQNVTSKSHKPELTRYNLGNLHNT